jgi:hypothetical protein
MTAVILFENGGPTDGTWLAKNEHGGFETLEPEHLQPGAEIRNEAPTGYSHFRITKILDDNEFEAVQIIPEGNDETYNFHLLIEA